MNIACGTDIIEIKRIKQSIETIGEKFLNRIYTINEINYCESKKSQKYQHYAARFAAKEAIFKASSKFIDNKFSVDWKDFEILNDSQGRPYVSKAANLKFNQIDISISHCKQYATANVIIIK